tara:strand:+ start:7482 stop:10946 length:3465 start_codon:yes stop_codon:yes gene_type:complete
MKITKKALLVFYKKYGIKFKGRSKKTKQQLLTNLGNQKKKIMIKFVKKYKLKGFSNKNKSQYGAKLRSIEITPSKRGARQLKKLRKDLKALKTSATTSSKFVKFGATLTKDKILKEISNVMYGTSVLVGANGNYFTLTSDNMPTFKKILESKTTQSGTGVFENYEELISSIKEMKGFDIVSIKIAEGDSVNVHSGGAFFRFTHKLKYDLTKYGIYEEVPKKYDDNCLIVALKEHNILTEPELNLVKSLCYNSFIPMFKLKKLCEDIDICIRITKYGYENKASVYNKKSKRIFKIGLIDSHYFIIDRTNINKYAICNWETLKDKKNWWNFKGENKRDLKRGMNSWLLIKYLFENQKRFLTSMSLEYNIFATQYYNKVDNVYKTLGYGKESVKISEAYKVNYRQFNLNYIRSKSKEDLWDFCVDNKFKIKKVNDKVVKVGDYYYAFDKGKDLSRYEELGLVEVINDGSVEIQHYNFRKCYFDFETTTDGDIHKPYLCCKKYSGGKVEDFVGLDCGKDLLDSLTEDTLLIAHNVAYDFRFVVKYLISINALEKGNGMMSGDAVYVNKKTKQIIRIKFKDSYKLITMPLRKFGKCFQLDQGKEVMPYDIYTEKNVAKQFVAIDEILKSVYIKDDEDKKILLNNIKKWKCGGELVDIIRYSLIYCRIDCEVLEKGYNKFRGWILKDLKGIDIDNVLTISSVAMLYMRIANCFEGVYKVAGVPRDFQQKCLVGGRCMTRDNKKWIINEDQVDYDAVSSYPSALYRMKGFLKGAPKVLKILTRDFIMKQSGFFVYILITKVNKKKHFPTLSYYKKNGIREYTNNMEGKFLYIDKIALEDAEEHHGLEYKIIKGYYYDQGHNNTICSVIKYLFDKRAFYKKAPKNPIEVVYKLILNSCYGKMIMKAIKTSLKVVDSVKERDKFILRNYNNIKCVSNIRDTDKYKITTNKAIHTHFTYSHIGVEILSMSKRLMNEVIATADDNNLPVFYTDTDSIHLLQKDLPKLEELINNKYKDRERVINGKYLGQFHSDFELDGAEEEVISKKCLILGKKCYIDDLESKDKLGKKITGLHYRMKGVPPTSIDHQVDKKYEDHLDLYEKLINSEIVEFDLLEHDAEDKPHRCRFNMANDYSITTLKKFTRKLKFVGEVYNSLNKKHINTIMC